MPLGLVVDQNKDPAAIDIYALVIGTTVINTVKASLNDIEAIKSIYDYSVDLTVQGQVAGIGWTYAPQTDTFSIPPPPPTNWVQVVQDDFDSLFSEIVQAFTDNQVGGLSQTNLANAFSLFMNDNQGQVTSNQLTLMNSIYQYILAGKI